MVQRHENNYSTDMSIWDSAVYTSEFLHLTSFFQVFFFLIALYIGKVSMLL